MVQTAPYKIVVISFADDSAAVILNERNAAVWAVESVANRAAASQRWSESSSGADEVTLFDPQALADLVPTVCEHHPQAIRIEVRGGLLTKEAREEFESCGFTSVRASGASLLASRASP